MADEWFRRKTWTDTDKAEFFSRLRRSQGAFHKAQYCRIQAVELQEAGHYREALELLDFLMTEWAANAQTAAVYAQQAECLDKLGQKTDAIAAFRQTFEEQRRVPSMITNAHLSFGLVVAQTPYPELFDEALSTLDEFESSAFPATVFKAAAARALISNAKQDFVQASQHARTALAAAATTHSGFSRHPDVGLVRSVEPGLRRKLERIATIR